MNRAIGRRSTIGWSRYLSVIGLVMAGVLLCASGFAIVDLRADAIDDYQRDMRNLGVVLVEQTSRSMQAVDLVVQETRDKFMAGDIQTAAEFRKAGGGEQNYHFLRSQLKSLPQADAVIVFGADGITINSTRAWPLPIIDVNDRDYFTEVRDHPDMGLFISVPVLARASGVWTFYLSRRVSGPHGEFLGVVAAAIAVRYLEDFYNAISLQEGGSVMLLRHDSTILARYPHVENQMGQRMPKGLPWDGLVDTGGGNYVTRGFIDGVTRAVSVNPAKEYPLVIDVTVSQKSVLAHWRYQSTLIAIATIIAAIGWAVLFRIIGRQFARLDRAEGRGARRSRRGVESGEGCRRRREQRQVEFPRQYVA
jgi:hypothetical protein